MCWSKGISNSENCNATAAPDGWMETCMSVPWNWQEAKCCLYCTCMLRTVLCTRAGFVLRSHTALDRYIKQSICSFQRHARVSPIPSSGLRTAREMPQRLPGRKRHQACSLRLAGLRVYGMHPLSRERKARAQGMILRLGPAFNPRIYLGQNFLRDQNFDRVDERTQIQEMNTNRINGRTWPG
ncbi:uncharacterized protein EKO05_0008284 [Ascochyta rabiei]|uniref:uncharacterized protein n=1 Tax=Didymella rabiei TaxID=5454 RepID=UPI00220F2596|nr:uncharacterized protein EKO05_0008284 [Ascochyta rabiei]UPX17960.1 hypothetical protein EKO05_0008284 [Ascochyta rabiei]